VDFVQGMMQGDADFGNLALYTANAMTFGALARPSRYFWLNQQYFTLLAKDPDAAKEWLNSADGQRLATMWDQQNMKPTDVVINEFALEYGPDDKVPTAEQIRARWLQNQPKAAKDELFATFNEAAQLNLWWDAQAELTAIHNPEGMRDLWVERETFFNGYYAEHQSVPFYWGLGMSKAEMDDWRSQNMTDMEVDDFFRMFDFDDAPSWDDPKARKEWEANRQSWLDAHPAVATFLDDHKSIYDKQVDLVHEQWGRAAKRMKEAVALRNKGYRTGDERLVELANMQIKGNAMIFDREVFGNDALPDEFGKRGLAPKLRPDVLGLKIRAAAGDEEAIRKAQYGQRMAGVILKATGKDGDLDPYDFHRILDRHPDLLEQYLLKNPKKREHWEIQGEYLKMWDRFGRLADKGLWDQAWDAYDNAPAAVREYMAERFPKKFAKWEMDSRYSAYMGKWVSLFEQGRDQEAMAYFNGLPSWAKERYYSTHPGQQMTSGGGTQYVSNLNTIFSLIDKGDWDGAEKVWNSMPAWMRKRYYANNPDSTLFRGKGGSGGGISDAKYKKYVGYMKKWADLQKDGKEGAANKYFKSLPKWVQDFHLRVNPDKALLKETLRMQTLVADFLAANKAHQQQMLIDSPALARWLNDNDAGAAWRNAVQYVYSTITDPWLKRVYREKYPEIFSDEAKGKAMTDDVMDTLEENPELANPWLKWYKHIATTLAEAMKYANARPGEFEMDHSRVRRRGSSHHGMSAEELSEMVEKRTGRTLSVNKRMPRPEA
jgi:hypothetical protein